MATHHGERMIAANGIDICTEAFGEPSDPAILLVMGAGASMLLWEVPFCERLADGGRFVIRYDNRDTGKTTSCPPGEPNYTLQDMAADGVAVLDAYNIERAHIVGASMGGMITQVIGLDHPDRVLSLTPIMSTPSAGAVLDAMNDDADASAHTLSPPTDAVLQAVASSAALDWSDPQAVLDNRVNMFRILSGSAYPFDEARRDIFAAEIERAVSFPSSLNHGPAIQGSDAWGHRLGELDVPTLVIHGTEDPILPYDHGQALHQLIPNAQLLTMEGVGHELPKDTWDTVVPTLLEHTS